MDVGAPRLEIVIGPPQRIVGDDEHLISGVHVLKRADRTLACCYMKSSFKRHAMFSEAWVRLESNSGGWGSELRVGNVEGIDGDVCIRTNSDGILEITYSDGSSYCLVSESRDAGGFLASVPLTNPSTGRSVIASSFDGVGFVLGGQSIDSPGRLSIETIRRESSWRWNKVVAGEADLMGGEDVDLVFTGAGECPSKSIAVVLTSRNLCGSDEEIALYRFSSCGQRWVPRRRALVPGRVGSMPAAFGNSVITCTWRLPAGTASPRETFVLSVSAESHDMLSLRSFSDDSEEVSSLLIVEAMPNTWLLQPSLARDRRGLLHLSWVSCDVAGMCEVWYACVTETMQRVLANTKVGTTHISEHMGRGNRISVDEDGFQLTWWGTNGNGINEGWTCAGSIAGGR